MLPSARISVQNGVVCTLLCACVGTEHQLFNGGVRLHFAIPAEWNGPMKENTGSSRSRVWSLCLGTTTRVERFFRQADSPNSCDCAVSVALERSVFGGGTACLALCRVLRSAVGKLPVAHLSTTLHKMRFRLWCVCFCNWWLGSWLVQGTSPTLHIVPIVSILQLFLEEWFDCLLGDKTG